MTLAGWITMTVVVGFMTSFLAWCSWKVALTSSSEHIHRPIELDTPDMHQDD